MNQIDNLMEEIRVRIERNERTLVTTLTKRMAEELNTYLQKTGINTAYIHSDVDTMDRIKILDDLRAGTIDVLVGVNLLREGLDLPEVSLVAILDADKEGFLRSHRSLTQTVGRAARNINGEVIMYADKITESMQQTIDETERRRSLQLDYNEKNGITPQAIIKARNSIIGMDAPEENAADRTRGHSGQAKKTAAGRAASIYARIHTRSGHSRRPCDTLYERRRASTPYRQKPGRNDESRQRYGVLWKPHVCATKS